MGDPKGVYSLPGQSVGMTLRVTFLGTSGAVPTVDRNPSALFINREGDRLLFDCAEGTQRQMMRFGTGFDLSAVFLTHLHGDHVYGLPGLLETLDFNNRQAPLDVYTPEGTADQLDAFLTALGTTPSFPLEIIEVPPDETVFRGDGYTIRTFPVDHRTTAVGYALVEDERKGRFDRQRAEELGVPVGPKFSQLHNGDSVELEDGRIVRPEQVVGPPRPGRRVVYTGDTRPTDRTVEIASEADLLVHDGTFVDDHQQRAHKTGHSTAREAARVAADADVRRLALVHFSSRYGTDTDRHKRQAQDVFDETVYIPDDGMSIEVPYPEQ